MTLLLLPVIVLGAAAVKLARYALVAVAFLMIAAIVLVWAWLRRRR